MRILKNPYSLNSLMNYDDVEKEYTIILKNLPTYMYILYHKLINERRNAQANQMIQSYINVAICNPESVTSIKRNHNSFVITDAYKSLRKSLPALFFEARVSDEFGAGLTTAFELDTTAQRRDESAAYISQPVEPDDIGSTDTLQPYNDIPFSNAVKLPICVTHMLSQNKTRFLRVRQYDPMEEEQGKNEIKSLRKKYEKFGGLYTKLLSKFKDYIKFIRGRILARTAQRPLDTKK